MFPQSGNVLDIKLCYLHRCRFHPSGDATPSDDDVRITKDAAAAAKLVSIDLLEHVILGQGRFVSLKEQGVL